ncbi:dolichyl-phosphate mannosyltransferase polypeptide 2, regulatory subunit [Cryptococcus neoformans C23]|uniref:Dolichol phosphate-mannose biosynthesis regulatory protein n=2 Tax=Cryptococcus neoformans TaxID=5207 RepID=A0A854QB29_CRYNE|nr:dolichyl-phosphate mannosyltransferase polypeptide 2, regulatory subunit [Cryptococcus neoformans var. grubii H99]AUB27686.1 dolichyl-phosphate mannosyltransferase polypeptide 2, regulatory subunit [Cryptococcus neoformans var. grubii]OWZ28247.1 dolichyl-phosphate mannosyltransferase polypeptide 2, regulatory subunit [Cryptococcus neoformans var. grubii AD2-60a]OWZ40562.1 dolichyl-phosphate mannosyltransferase polypeptide 2, regulatory subunit [Cryptococcus neoformans var. grubii C23]OWZ5146|eukprot:XP_012052067.1 dolichyl-phosphate mannosyltransferase polypeptide 2, regulatory subunit [Cryptococcus neoformans var. grubii H99]
MATSDKLLGGAMLFIAAFVFVYYTIWALLLPFLPPTSTIPSYFPPRSYAIKLPIFLLLTGVCGVTLFFGRVMLTEARKKRVKGGKKV